jgi:hypothetical protein
MANTGQRGLKMRINLGDKVRDTLTGIEGIVFGRTSYLTGCDHLGLKRPCIGPDGKAFELHWVDEPLLELLETQSYSPADPERALEPTGGPSLHGFSR